MSNTGRYRVRLPSGRIFEIEPVEDRVRGKDWGWYEGLVPAKGGAVRPEDSVITPATHRNIQIVANPTDVIEAALRDDEKAQDEQVQAAQPRLPE